MTVEQLAQPLRRLGQTFEFFKEVAYPAVQLRAVLS